MTEQISLVPKRRFKEFHGKNDWEQRKIREMLAEPVTDGPHETPKLEESGIPFISVDAIVDNQINFDRKRGYISEKTDELYSKKYRPQYHDVFLVKSGSTVGKTAIVETKERFNIWSPLAAMRVSEVSDPYFLYFLLQTKKMQNQVKDKASNGTQPNLGMRELEKFHTQITLNLKEQKTIGAFFQKLDKLINLQQHKLDKIKELKVAYLSEMFPAEGKLVPKRRFSGFTQDWVQRRMEDLAEVSTGRAFSSKDFSAKGEYLVVTNKNIQDEERRIVSSGDRIDILDDKIAKKYILSGENILVTMDGVNIGKTGRYSNEKAVLAQRVGRLRSDQHDFIYQVTSNNKFITEMNRISVGNAIKHISLSQISNYSFMAPVCTDEQFKIGNFFKQLDDIITHHQSKLEKLQNLKKAYLHEMFV